MGINRHVWILERKRKIDVIYWSQNLSKIISNLCRVSTIFGNKCENLVVEIPLFPSILRVIFWINMECDDVSIEEPTSVTVFNKFKCIIPHNYFHRWIDQQTIMAHNKTVVTVKSSIIGIWWEPQYLPILKKLFYNFYVIVTHTYSFTDIYSLKILIVIWKNMQSKVFTSKYPYHFQELKFKIMQNCQGH